MSLDLKAECWTPKNVDLSLKGVQLFKEIVMVCCCMVPMQTKINTNLITYAEQTLLGYYLSL